MRFESPRQFICILPARVERNAQRLFWLVSIAAVEMPPSAASAAFAHRSTASLLRSAAVFRALQIPVLVRNAREGLALSERILGSTLTLAVVRETIFKQFCGGECMSSLKPTLSVLSSAGVGAILDYAAEADLGEAGDSTTPAALDACADEFVLALSRSAGTGGFAAAKLTSFAAPQLLADVTARMHEHRRAFRALLATASAEGGSGDDALEASPESSPYLERTLDARAFAAALALRGVPADAARRAFALLDVRRVGAISYLDFCDAARMVGFGSESSRAAAAAAAGAPSPDALLALLLGSPDVGLLPREARDAWGAVEARIARLAASATDSGCSLLIDAEQSYLQAGIDLAVVTAQRRFNRPLSQRPVAGGSLPPLPEEAHARVLAGLPAAGEHAFSGGGAPSTSAPSNGVLSSSDTLPIWNTYQAYTRCASSRLNLALLRARTEGWGVATKLVRGAYMVQERERARALGYNDPIHASYAATTLSYHSCLRDLLDDAAARRGSCMVATHSAESVEFALTQMRERGLEPPPRASPAAARAPGAVTFAQLLGMGDALTYGVAARGHAAFKYVPYGPVKGVIPYLLRRAEENSDLLTGNARAELDGIRAELGRRAKGALSWRGSQRGVGPQSAN